jgi:hypothetical protein
MEEQLEKRDVFFNKKALLFKIFYLSILQIIHIHPHIFFTVVERLNALSISHALKTMHMEQANVLAIIMYMVPTLLRVNNVQ